ncbi:collagen-like triple helix repeat-containing protein [Anatilimnocola floriformis]|uniref:collagen-like triple helix repeat-containing protein n=1 Tax=Anatilimnocola floriformis TaxID=2948575 RepID=UPI0020C38B77|nr:collagen-like protein [Anatilimnocola floriformis]
MKTTVALLTARGAQVPSGEEARIETVTISGADRKVLSYDTTQYAIYTVPYWPDIYLGTGTLKLEIAAYTDGTDTTAVGWSVQVEAITAADAVNLSSAASFDTANTATQAAPGTAGRLFLSTVTLSNKDSVAVADYVRIKIVRSSDSNTDTAKVVGITLYEETTQVNFGQDALNDTFINTPSSGQYLRYNGSQWTNEYASGITGATGPQGPQGSSGAQGVQGSQGHTGAQGSAGMAGSQGNQGHTGPQGSQGSQGSGSQGSQGSQGSPGSQGAYGGVTSHWYWDSDTSAPPANNSLAFNNGTFASVTSVMLHDLNQTGVDLSGFVSSLVVGDKIRVFDVNDSVSKFWLGTITSITDNSTYYSLGVTYIASAGNFSSTSLAGFTIAMKGAQGSQGSAGVQGSQGAQGPQGAAGGGTGGGSQGPQGSQGSQGSAGAQGSQGAYGGVTSDWNFSTEVDPPPGNQQMRFNNATLTSVSTIFIDDQNSANVDMSGFLGAFNTGDWVRVFDVNASTTNFLIGIVTNIVDNSGYFSFSVAYVAHAGSFASVTKAGFTIAPIGPRGATGASGSSGAAGTSYTDEMAQDACFSNIQAGQGIQANYADASNVYQLSVDVAKSITFDSNSLVLVNDETSPSAGKYYGTGSQSSTKGWYTLPEGGGGGGSPTAINDIADATGAGAVELGSNSWTLNVASGVQALNVTTSMGAADVQIPAGNLVLGQSGSNLGIAASYVSIGAGGAYVGFRGVTPVALPTMPLNSDTSGAALQTTINAILTALNAQGIIGIDI